MARVASSLEKHDAYANTKNRRHPIAQRVLERLARR
jgi:uncharacterized protein with ATP-grasp and redox domains